ncbi:hypothetical protein O3I_002435 [Nocardia brasiliensis ATCC 700358]|uniref:Uncharacterized protein n=1 Tax=Nocardia brasiliensis (strain ATCC 700358 / HUJEG-1) TaxID=1133849 RepID=K0ENG4_NOCB7|nr:hypothetical protein O3I_002435 [Nocardia brasiliensis ATCC 700358]
MRKFGCSPTRYVGWSTLILIASDWSGHWPAAGSFDAGAALVEGGALDSALPDGFGVEGSAVLLGTEVDEPAATGFESPGESPPRDTVSTSQITSANATTKAPIANARRRQ